jgi:hypothetical protein
MIVKPTKKFAAVKRGEGIGLLARR